MDSQKLHLLNLGMPNNLGEGVLSSSLSSFELEIIQVVHHRWPTSALEIAEFLGHTLTTREHKRTLSSRLTYHLKKLVHKRVLMSKRIGNALMVWPYEVEKFRLMHELFPHSPRAPLEDAAVQTLSSDPPAGVR
jgi:hypothetical protein